MAWDSQGRLYVANRSEAVPRVTVIDIDDEYYLEFGSPTDRERPEGVITWPSGIAVDSSDTIYVSDQSTHRINLYDRQGNLLEKWGATGSAEGELKEPSGLVFDAEDNLYVSDTGNNRIQMFNKKGEFLQAWGRKGSAEGQLNLPWGLALDAENNVYVADWGNDRVQKFTSEGEFLLAVGTSGDGNGQLKHPSGVAVDRGGDIYVADWANDRLQVFDPTGRYQVQFTGDATLSKWGLEIILGSPDFARERHRATLEPERRFWRPNAVKVDSQDRIFVVDTSRHRMQIYQKESVLVDAEWIDLENPKRELQIR